jgi:hypothetical protein
LIAKVKVAAERIIFWFNQLSLKGVSAFIFWVGALFGTLLTNEHVFRLAELDEECRSKAADLEHEMTRFEISDLKLEVILLHNSTVRIAYLGEKNSRLDQAEQNLLNLQTELDRVRRKIDRIAMQQKKACDSATVVRADAAWSQNILSIWMALTGFFAALWLGQTRAVLATTTVPKTRARKSKITKDTK